VQTLLASVITGATGNFTTINAITAIVETGITKTNLTVTGNVNASGNLTVAGSGSFGSGVSVTGSGFFGSGISVTGTVSGVTVQATTGVFSSGNFASGLLTSGIIQSTTGGFRFPDGTTQTTAATAGVSLGLVIALGG